MTSLNVLQAKNFGYCTDAIHACAHLCLLESACAGHHCLKVDPFPGALAVIGDVNTG